ncbi:DUF6783 domain-containing protein [Lacrimispora indolis]
MFLFSRICLKTACSGMCVTLCEKFVPDEGCVVGCASLPKLTSINAIE